MKKCTKCGEWKLVSEFYKYKWSKDGLKSQCKMCDKKYYENNKEKIKEQQKEYRENNKEKIKEYYENNKEKILKQKKDYYENNKEKIKDYYENNYVRRWCTDTIRLHKNRGYIVNITIDELYNIVKDEPICEICGKELEWYSTGKGKPTNLSPSLDRIYNGNEINKDNISILCYKCNAKKHSDSIEENLVWCKQFIEYANKKLGDN
jgi:hypothetical protein